MKKYLIPGVHDFYHKGHQNLVNYARQDGTPIIALINDEGVNLKQKQNVSPYSERYQMIKDVDQSLEIIETNSTPESYLKIYKDNELDGIIFGNDHEGTDKVNFLRQNNVNVIILPRTAGISSTIIREKA